MYVYRNSCGVSFSSEMDPVIYEFSIHELSKSDPRWGNLWREFLSSCSTPRDPLPHLNHEEYLRNKTNPPKIFKDTILEIWLKLKNRFRSQDRIRRQGVTEEADEEDGWFPSQGKYSRQYNAASANPHITRVLQLLCQIFQEPHIPHRGNFYYPPNGYREWHTNQFDLSGWRLYLIHTLPTGCSLFRYHLPSTPLDEITNAIDHDGMVRLFRIPDKRETGGEVLWHNIVSDGQRWSLGVLLNERNAQQLLELYDPQVTYGNEGGDQTKTDASVTTENEGG